LDLVADAKKRLAVPIIGIGGITPANAPQLISAGIDAVAVISAVFAAPDIEAAARELQSLFELH
jgi:thiamine-phosphate pyrophosphorylase